MHDISWYVVDYWGRRFILLSGAAIMAIALSLIGYFMYLDATFTPLAVVVCVIIYNACAPTAYTTCPRAERAQLLRLLMGPHTGTSIRAQQSACLTIHAVALPARDSAAGSAGQGRIAIDRRVSRLLRLPRCSPSAATNWAANFLVGESTPILQESIRWRLYPMFVQRVVLDLTSLTSLRRHAFFCVCSFLLGAAFHRVDRRQLILGQSSSPFLRRGV
jgi:hypothetical protein